MTFDLDLGLTTFDLDLDFLFKRLKSLGWWVGGCTYDYNISLSPNLLNLRLKTFDLDLDFGLTIVDIEINTRTTAPNLGKRHT